MTFEAAFKAKHDQLLKDLQGESDRAAVIIAAAHVDEILGDMLKTALVPSPTSTDQMFDGPNAPLANLSNRIDFCYRLGLISASAAKSLHIMRRIRNSFAHHISGCSFKDPTVDARVEELYKLHRLDQKHPDIQEIFGSSVKAKFLMSAIVVIGVMQEMQYSLTSIKPKGAEWPYVWLQGN